MGACTIEAGGRSHIPWVVWACGPAQSLQVWRDIYRPMGPDELAAAVGTVHGIQARRAQIDATIPPGWMLPTVRQLFLGDERWLGSSH